MQLPAMTYVMQDRLDTGESRADLARERGTRQPRRQRRQLEQASQRRQHPGEDQERGSTSDHARLRSRGPDGPRADHGRARGDRRARPPARPLDKELRSYARRQPGCRALRGQFGVGEVTAVTILAELGDARRFSSSREAVRYAGMDITVHQSDQRRSPGHLSRQGPPALRWALFEAAQSAARAGSPDLDYYRQAAERLGANRACLSVARKLLKRSFHTLRELGEEALQPA